MGHSEVTSQPCLSFTTITRPRTGGVGPAGRAGPLEEAGERGEEAAGKPRAAKAVGPGLRLQDTGQERGTQPRSGLWSSKQSEDTRRRGQEARGGQRDSLTPRLRPPGVRLSGRRRGEGGSHACGGPSASGEGEPPGAPAGRGWGWAEPAPTRPHLPGRACVPAACSPCALRGHCRGARPQMRTLGIGLSGPTPAVAAALGALLGLGLGLGWVWTLWTTPPAPGAAGVLPEGWRGVSVPI